MHFEKGQGIGWQRVARSQPSMAEQRAEESLRTTRPQGWRSLPAPAFLAS